MSSLQTNCGYCRCRHLLHWSRRGETQTTLSLHRCRRGEGGNKSHISLNTAWRNINLNSKLDLLETIERDGSPLPPASGVIPEVGREGDQTVEEVRSGGRQEGGAARVALGATRGQSEPNPPARAVIWQPSYTCGGSWDSSCDFSYAVCSPSFTSVVWLC